MLIAECPECHDPIRIPIGTTEASRARCPWCNESYYLADVLEKLPPVVEIIEGPGTEETVIAATAAEADNYQLLGAEAESDFNFKESESTGSSAAPMAKITRRDRPAKKQASGALEFAKIIGGGVAGCLIAILVVWYGFRKDIGGLATKLPAWTYVIVPHEIWTPEMQEAAENAAAPEIPQEQNTSAKPLAPIETITVSTDENGKPKMPENDLSKAFQESINRAENSEEPVKKNNLKNKNSKTDEPKLEDPKVEEKTEEPVGEPEEEEGVTDLEVEEPLILPKFESEVDEKVDALVDAINLELGPIGAEIPTPEEVEAFNNSEEKEDE